MLISEQVAMKIIFLTLISFFLVWMSYLIWGAYFHIGKTLLLPYQKVNLTKYITLELPWGTYSLDLPDYDFSKEHNGVSVGAYLTAPVDLRDFNIFGPKRFLILTIELKLHNKMISKPINTNGLERIMLKDYGNIFLIKSDLGQMSKQENIVQIYDPIKNVSLTLTTHKSFTNQTFNILSHALQTLKIDNTKFDKAMSFELEKIENTIAESANTEDLFPIPRAPEVSIKTEPIKVFDLLTLNKIKSLNNPLLLDNGSIVFTSLGSGSQENRTVLAVLQPDVGLVRTMSTENKDNQTVKLFIGSDKSFGWLVYRSPNEIKLVDFVNFKIIEIDDLYQGGLAEYKKSIEQNYPDYISIDSSNRLLLEWSHYVTKNISNEIIWSRSSQEWLMELMPNSDDEINLESSAAFESPANLLRSKKQTSKLPIQLAVKTSKNHPTLSYRPKPSEQEGQKFYAPINDDEQFSFTPKLAPIELTTKTGLAVTPFERTRNLQTMQPCKSLESIGVSPLKYDLERYPCSKFHGAYVERADNGLHISTLNHGTGTSRATSLLGQLLAVSGENETSIWDISTGKLLSRLNRPSISHVRSSNLIFSKKEEVLYELIDGKTPKIIVWKINKEWAKLYEL